MDARGDQCFVAGGVSPASGDWQWYGRGKSLPVVSLLHARHVDSKHVYFVMYERVGSDVAVPANSVESKRLTPMRPVR
jgi:hypothetical protein